MPGQPPPTGPRPGDATAPVVRRRLQSANPQDTKGRGGCLLTGAILGIIFGLTFAFYGLPPILRHYYGEKHVDAGQAYVDGDRRLEVFALSIGPDSAEGGTNTMVVFVTVNASGFEDDEPRPGRFRLEVDGVENWILPLPQLPSPASPTDADVHQIELRFPVPEGLDPRGLDPVALHLEDPRVRFALGEVVRPGEP